MDAVCRVIFQKSLHAPQHNTWGQSFLYCRNLLKRKINSLQKAAETVVDLKTSPADRTGIYTEFDSFLQKEVGTIIISTSPRDLKDLST